jgi:sulfotransferase
MFAVMQTMLSGRNEFHVFIDDRKRRAILRGILENYYADVQDKIVFDTNRGWCSKLPALVQLFPDAKVICCVRPIPWILDSLERIIRLNALEPSRMFNFESSGNAYTRADVFNSPTGLIGTAYGGLKEAFYGEHSERLIVVTYDSLTKRPMETLDAVYEFIGEPRFEHDLENVEFDAEEYDVRLGTPGLHRVAKVVAHQERETILPPDLVKRYEALSFWSAPEQNKRRVQVI